jgi:hypothetical protein
VHSLTRQEVVIVTLTEWEYQLFFVENQSDSRKKGKQSRNKIRHLLTAKRVKEKMRWLQRTILRRSETERTNWWGGKCGEKAQ